MRKNQFSFVLFINCSSSLRSDLSRMKVPNGSREAINAMKTFLNPQLASNFALINKMMYSTNNNPCTHPVYFTASGRSAKYFKGIAINRRTRKDIPSMMAIILKRPMDVLEKLNDIFTFSIDKIIMVRESKSKPSFKEVSVKNLAITSY